MSDVNRSGISAQRQARKDHAERMRVAWISVASNIATMLLAVAWILGHWR